MLSKSPERGHLWKTPGIRRWAVVAALAILGNGWAQTVRPPFVLEGVIVAARPEGSLTLIRLDGARRGRTLAVGELAAGFRLLEVFRDAALFESEGRVVRLELASESPKPGSAPRAPDPAPSGVEKPAPFVADPVADSIQRDELEWQRRRFNRADVNRRLVKELPVILSDTGLTPRVRDGEMEGLRVTRIPDGTLLSESGLLPGDTLVSLNGAPVRGLNSLMGLLSGLQSADEVRLVVERGGEPVRLLYEVR